MPYIIAASVILLLAGITVLISYITYKITFKRGRCVTDPYEVIGKNQPYSYEERMKGMVTKLLETPYEDVEMRSHDGLRLHARLYLTSPEAPVEIQLHGYRSLSLRDFSGGACEAIDKGHNVLLIDQRAHGKSEGNTISFGALEVEDCLGWIKFVKELFGEEIKIILMGISMGAATVLLASARELPPNVKGIIADCPYSSAKEIITRVGYRMRYPMKLLYPFLKLGAKLFGGFSVEDAEPIGIIDKARVPILLIHGENDDFVPHEMSVKLKEKNPNIHFHTFPEAEHGTSYCVDPERYRQTVNDFLGEILK